MSSDIVTWMFLFGSAVSMVYKEVKKIHSNKNEYNAATGNAVYPFILSCATTCVDSNDNSNSNTHTRDGVGGREAYSGANTESDGNYGDTDDGDGDGDTDDDSDAVSVSSMINDEF